MTTLLDVLTMFSNVSSKQDPDLNYLLMFRGKMRRDSLNLTFHFLPVIWQNLVFFAALICQILQQAQVSEPLY
jgi:hypothetical protein